MALESEIHAIAATAEGREQASRLRKAQERIRTIGKMNRIRAYRALFLDDAGNLKPDAVKVIADLAKVAQLGTALPMGSRDEIVREANGRRAIALHVIEQIDLSSAKLRQLAIKLREQGNE